MMKRHLLGFSVLCLLGPCAWAQPAERSNEPAEGAEKQAIIERLHGYIQAFNSHDAAEVAEYWAEDGVSVVQSTGDRTEGRKALQAEFERFFEANPRARLSGDVDAVHQIRPDVVQIDGHTSLLVSNAEAAQSLFSAVLVKQGDDWLISSSHESELPAPESPSEALSELEWLVGTWEDQIENAQVTTRVRWAPGRAYLIRSFEATLDSETKTMQGTQIIGWDPLNKQIRSWTFQSDGSFGEGTVSRNDEDWMLKMWEILPDGRMASATKVMTRVDENTMTVQTIGETIDGAPMPTFPPVTVVRVADTADHAPEANSSQSKTGANP